MQMCRLPAEVGNELRRNPHEKRRQKIMSLLWIEHSTFRLQVTEGPLQANALPNELKRQAFELIHETVS